MKVTIDGNTPMERLTNFTKKIMAVPKGEIVAAKHDSRKRKMRRKKASS